jgi:hypothetical protein
MTAVILAFTLSWTVPAFQSTGPRQCAASTNREGAVECVLYRHRQSATWRAMRPAMEAMGDVWAATWPTVAWEARAQVVARFRFSAFDGGKRFSYTVADTSGGPWSYFVTSTDWAGNVSCQSNEVMR